MVSSSKICFSPNHLHLRSIYAHHLLYMLRVHRQYGSGTAAGQRLLFGGMYGQKGYGQEQPVPVACGVHQIREFTWSDMLFHQKCFLEAWHIQSKNSMNREDGLLPHVYNTLSTSYDVLITFVSCSCTFPELLLCAKS